MNWFQAIIDFLHQFWPLCVVYSYQRGIRFWLGVDKKELGPGLYAFIPFFGHIEVVNVAPDVLKLFDQNVTTKDGVGVMINANVLFTIVDARASFINVQDLQHSLGDAMRRHLAKRVREWTWPELTENQSELERSLKRTMTNSVKDWGVRIDDAGFTCFIKTKNFSLVNL